MQNSNYFLGKNTYKVGESLRDVKNLARHSILATTKWYIQADTQAKWKLVDMV